MEPSSIAIALSGIKNAIDIAKAIKDSDSTLEIAMLKNQMAELINALTDAKVEVANFKELILEKDESIKELEKKFKINSSIKWEAPYYFLVNEGKNKEGPFCQKCYDGDQKLIRLQSETGNGYWTCRECNNSFTDSTYESQIGLTSRRRGSSGLQNLY